MSTPPNERSRRSQAPPPHPPQPRDPRSSSLSSATSTNAINRRNEGYIASADAGTSGGLMSRLRQSQRQSRVQEDLGHIRSDPDNPFTVRQTPARQAPPQEARFRSPDMDSPPGLSTWPAPVIRQFADRDSSSPTLGIMQRQQQQQRGATSSSYRYRHMHSDSGAGHDGPLEEAPSSTPMKRKLSLSLGQDGDSDEDQDDRGDLANSSVLQRTISAGHRPQHDQQQQQHQTPTVPADTGLRNVFHVPSSTAGLTTPEGFSLFRGQPPRIPDLPGPGQRLLPEGRTFAVTPTARLSGTTSISNNNDGDETESLWTSVGRRAVMRLKYGLYDEDVDEDVEGEAGTQAVRSEEQEVTSGSGSRTNTSAQSDQSTAGSSFWVGKQGFQIPSQDQQPRRDVRTRQQQQHQQGVEMSDRERPSYQQEEIGSALSPAGAHETQQFSDDDDNVESSDARELRMKQTFSRSAVGSASVMRPPLLNDSRLEEKVATESGSQEISPDARMLMALEAELERAMLDPKGKKDGADHSAFGDGSPFDHELDLSTDVLLQELFHEHDQPLSSPAELELRSWMYEEGQIGRPQRVGHFASL